MSITNLNFNISDLTSLARDIGTSSVSYVKDVATSLTSNTYEYGRNRIEAGKQKVEPYIPTVLQYAETTAALAITGVALLALANLATHLPIVDTLAALTIAGYALSHPEQCAQAVAIFAIGSIVVKTLALSTCSLPLVQIFALYFAAVIINTSC